VIASVVICLDIAVRLIQPDADLNRDEKLFAVAFRASVFVLFLFLLALLFERILGFVAAADFACLNVAAAFTALEV
jgi:hypothetical protein